MKIDDKMIEEISSLAKLKFEGAEREAIKEDMQKILNFMDKLNELDTDDVRPLEYVHEIYQKLRVDEVHQTISKEEALRNAPQKDSDYIKVPKVLKKK
ncbi:MAG TPA: Asp-tRNA(Asn)/Glu-tRNA(Gln) amidotransferase GatCAB subunit C [Flavobacteriales bacterium]|jgi:aspartyl-tRNA(Asn)/glutamyl-tRNA(Gln) amidotransferase subunit C|nr:Asp-tRNA(Asn)/Glu-tRNA(Gln) amidotransferase GatCAB subunit C [Flavobacteriales bacterium]